MNDGQGKSRNNLESGDGLSELSLAQLDQPQLSLSPEGSLQYITEFIALGAEAASVAAGKNIICFLGNTGAGKSTAINFLRGCSFEYFLPKEAGFEQLRIKADSKIKSIVEIGHGKKSKTFIPTLASDEKHNLIYCDCPGFSDTRGPEVEIANMANIKRILQNAKSIKLFLIIDYPSLLAGRGSAIQSLVRIIKGFFLPEPKKSASLEQKAWQLDKNIINSILVGVTQIYDSTTSLERIRHILCCGEGGQFWLRENIIIFDPMKKSTMPGMVSRLGIVEHINRLVAITDSSIFTMPLTPKSIVKLAEVSRELNKKIENCLKKKEFHQAANYIKDFKRLKILDQPFVNQLYEQNVMTIKQYLQRHQWQAQDATYNLEFKAAEGALEWTRSLCEALAPDLDLNDYLAQQEIFLQGKKLEQRLKEIRQNIVTLCGELDTAITLDKCGKAVLTELQVEQGDDLLDRLCLIHTINGIIKILQKFIGEAKEIGLRIKDPSIDENYRKIVYTQLNRIKIRLIKSEALEELHQAEPAISAIFSELEQHLLKVSGSTAEALKAGMANIEALLIKIQRFCDVVGDPGRFADYKKSCADKFLRLRQKSQQMQAASLTKKFRGTLINGKWQEARLLFLQINTLAPSQRGGFEVLGSQVNYLKNSFTVHLANDKYLIAAKNVDDLVKLAEIFPAELKENKSTVDINSIISEIRVKNASLKKQAQQAIGLALAENLLNTVSIIFYRAFLQAFQARLELGDYEKQCDELILLIKKHYSEVKLQIQLEEKSGFSSSLEQKIQKMVSFMVQLQTIISIIKIPILLKLSTNLLDEFFKDYAGEELCSFYAALAQAKLHIKDYLGTVEYYDKLLALKPDDNASKYRREQAFRYAKIEKEKLELAQQAKDLEHNLEILQAALQNQSADFLDIDKRYAPYESLAFILKSHTFFQYRGEVRLAAARSISDLKQKEAYFRLAYQDFHIAFLYGCARELVAEQLLIIEQEIAKCARMQSMTSSGLFQNGRRVALPSLSPTMLKKSGLKNLLLLNNVRPLEEKLQQAIMDAKNLGLQAGLTRKSNDNINAKILVAQSQLTDLEQHQKEKLQQQEQLKQTLIKIEADGRKLQNQVQKLQSQCQETQQELQIKKMSLSGFQVR